MIARTPLDAMAAAKMRNIAGKFPDRSEIEAEQMRLLRSVVEYCKSNSPFYRQKLKDIEADSLTGIEDISAIPLISKDDIRNFGTQMLCVSSDEIARIITMQSSGTTGKPKRIFFTDDDLKLTYDFFRGGMLTMVSPGDKVLILLPGEKPDSTGDILKRALESQGISAKVCGLAPDPLHTAELIRQEKPQCIVGFPIHLLAAARVDTGHKIPSESIKSLLLCSDYIPDVVAKELESTWNCENFIHYGTVETGLGGGVECAAHSGVHLRETDLLFEIIDSENGEPLPYGMEGEIVVTTLTRKGMPLLRYRTGDLAAMYEKKCACGSHLRRLGRVRGRFENKCRLSTGFNISLSSLDEKIFQVPDVTDFNVEMSDCHGCETVRIDVSTVHGREDECRTKISQILNDLNIFNNIKLEIECLPVSTVNIAKRIIKDNREGLHHERIS